MRSLLAVPIVSGGDVMGNLYLAEKLDGEEFTSEDEDTLGRFATQAGVAITNARLHRRVRSLAIVEERERIGREMHDSLAQVLGYVNTKAQAAQELIAAGHPEKATQHIDQLAESARSAYVDVRENILALRTSATPDRPLAEALRDYVAAWQEQSGVDTRVAIDAASAGRLSSASEVQLLRIVQEALANVRKHAAATQVSIRLSQTDGSVEVVVEDNGAGFEPDALARSAFPRFGLATMRERAEAAGGTLVVESAPGQGTRVVARLPIGQPGTIEE
jgi:signal transduction histidine kinase